MKMKSKSQWPEKNICGLMVLFKIGSLIGLLPVKYNPLKLCSKDGPFETSWMLTVYSCLLWMSYTFASIHVVTMISLHAPQILIPVLFLVLSIQLYFIFWIILARKSVPQILNKLTQLVQESPKLQIKITESLAPYIPIAILFPLKTILDFKWMVLMPVLHCLVVFQLLSIILTNGLIYTWIMCGEKLYFNINHYIKLKSRRISANKLKTLMTHSSDIEAFIYYISKSCGIPYLTISIFTVCVDIMYSHEEMYSVFPVLQLHRLQALENLVNLIQWNYSLYIMACVCYRSHKLNMQVKKLKWSLEEVQAKGFLDSRILQMVQLFENTIATKQHYFSAFGNLNFNISLLIIVLNKTVTYLFAISPIRQAEEGSPDV